MRDRPLADYLLRQFDSAKKPLVKWINSQNSFIQSQQQELHYSKWSIFELSAFLFVLAWVSIIIFNSESNRGFVLVSAKLAVYVEIKQRNKRSHQSQTHCIAARLFRFFFDILFFWQSSCDHAGGAAVKDFLPFVVFSIQQGSHVVITIQKESSSPHHVVVFHLPFLSLSVAFILVDWFSQSSRRHQPSMPVLHYKSYTARIKIAIFLKPGGWKEDQTIIRHGKKIFQINLKLN